MCFTDEYNVLRPMDERKPTGLSLSVSANLCTVPCFICTTTTSIIALHLQVSYKHLHHLAFVAEFPFLIFLANQKTESKYEITGELNLQLERKKINFPYQKYQILHTW